MNYIAGFLLLAGFGCFVTDWYMISSSSFDDGTFLLKLILGIAGIGMIVISVILKVILLMFNSN